MAEVTIDAEPLVLMEMAHALRKRSQQVYEANNGRLAAELAHAAGEFNKAAHEGDE